MSENLHAVAQQNNRPFVQVAAWIKRRTYRSRDGAAIHHSCTNGRLRAARWLQSLSMQQIVFKAAMKSDVFKQVSPMLLCQTGSMALHAVRGLR